MEQPFFMNSASVSSKSILILVTIGNKYDFELRRLLDQNAIKFEGLDFNFVIRLRFFGRLPDERLEEVESSHKCRLSRIIWPKIAATRNTSGAALFPVGAENRRSRLEAAPATREIVCRSANERKLATLNSTSIIR